MGFFISVKGKQLSNTLIWLFLGWEWIWWYWKSLWRWWETLCNVGCRYGAFSGHWCTLDYVPTVWCTCTCGKDQASVQHSHVRYLCWILIVFFIFPLVRFLFSNLFLYKNYSFILNELIGVFFFCRRSILATLFIVINLYQTPRTNQRFGQRIGQGGEYIDDNKICFLTWGCFACLTHFIISFSQVLFHLCRSYAKLYL